MSRTNSFNNEVVEKYTTTQGANLPPSPNDARNTPPLPGSDAMAGAGGGSGSTTGGASIGPSPNNAKAAMGRSYPESNPTGGGNLPNGATSPSFDSAALARQGMGSGNEAPIMARGMPGGARIGSGDLRRGAAPMEAGVARPSGGPGLAGMGLASVARKGGYIPLDPQRTSAASAAPVVPPLPPGTPQGAPKNREGVNENAN